MNTVQKHVEEFIIRLAGIGRIDNRGRSVEADSHHACRLVDLNDLGAVILIPRIKPLPGTRITLEIPSPAISHINHTGLAATVRWLDEHFSPQYRKAGLEFEGPSEGDRHTIRNLQNWFRGGEDTFLVCRIVNRC